ncbi:hypothetical protein PAPYR_907 [Paratrimastix pyriformis]|uniref:Uncharacterized protein n=1 Tax=Paratrimastix pyriformis TaxID=342808 RepID=A0ABQ8UZS2_9EUKA|nr:hypothetical protein PAPYR_907 [Paratrimastix pyriformis]
MKETLLFLVLFWTWISLIPELFPIKHKVPITNDFPKVDPFHFPLDENAYSEAHGDSCHAPMGSLITSRPSCSSEADAVRDQEIPASPSHRLGSGPTLGSQGRSRLACQGEDAPPAEGSADAASCLLTPHRPPKRRQPLLIAVRAARTAQTRAR